MSAAVCNSCHADITWATTPNGRQMPLDPPRYDRADETANIAVYRDHTGRIRGRVLTRGEVPARFEWRAMPHFATCRARHAAA